MAPEEVFGRYQGEKAGKESGEAGSTGITCVAAVRPGKAEEFWRERIEVGVAEATGWRKERGKAGERGEVGVSVEGGDARVEGWARQHQLTLKTLGAGGAPLRPVQRRG